MRVRVRGPNGQSALTLSDDASISDLKGKLVEATSIAEFEVKYGYPPKPLELGTLPPTTKLSQLEVKLNGEQLIVSAKAAPPAQDGPPKAAPSSGSSEARAGTSTGESANRTFPSRPADAAPPAAPLSLQRKASANDPPEIPMPAHDSTLVLRIMPDDNSCLFRAFNSAYFGAMDNMHELRSIIAQAIQADPETFSDVVLERAPDDYCRWIQTPDAWGGQIELEILSKHFDVEICSIDVQTLRVDRYNEGRPTRCILVYSGIHYDVVALSQSDPPHDKAHLPPEFDVKVFDARDEEVLQKAVGLCRLLQRQGYFTDTAAFSVKCNVCGGVFVGEAGATEHAKQTGHYDFGET